MVRSVIGLFILFILGVGLFFVVSTNLFVVALASTDVNETPKPTVPEFTLKYVDHSYDVPPVYGIDQFTGKEVITQPGYRRHNQSFVFKIKHQLFTPYNDSDGNEINLYFNFRYKGHFGDEWKYYPFLDSGKSRIYCSASVPSFCLRYVIASSSEYTNVTLSLQAFFFGMDGLGSDDQVDFQVQTLIGHIDRHYRNDWDKFLKFEGQRSAWSETQVIPEFPSWIIIPLFIIATVVVIIYRNSLRRQVC